VTWSLESKLSNRAITEEAVTFSTDRIVDLRGRAKQSQASLMSSIANFTTHKLLETVPGWNWNNYLMIHGTLHHDIYRAGQIALSRRQLEAKRDIDRCVAI